MASTKVRGITIELTADSSGLIKGLKSVNSEISNTSKKLRDVERLLKLDPTNTDLLQQKQKLLGERVEETRTKLKALKTTQEEVGKALKETGEGQEQFDALTREIVQTEDQLKKAEDALNKFNITGEKLKAVGAKFDDIGQKIKSAGDKVTSFGESVTRNVTTPLAALGGLSLKSFTDWESAFTGVQKTVDATAEEYEELSDWIKDASTKMASSKEDIAGVMEISGQLGVSGVDNLEKFTETMVKLGDTTNLSSEDAATNLARFMNIAGTSYTDADRLGSSIVDLGNNFATSEAEIVEMATRLASAGTLAGLTETDILALATAMSSVGIQAEAGGTAMTQTLTAIEKAVEGSSTKLDTFARISGMSADQFSTIWKEKPIEALSAFVRGLSELDPEAESVISVLDELELSGVRQSNMIKSLTLANEMLNDAVTTSKTAWEENTALTEEAELRYGTFASKLTQTKEELKNVGIEIGERLLPYVDQLIGFIDRLVAEWDALSEEEQNTIVQVALVVAALGPLITILGNVITSIGAISQAIGWLLANPWVLLIAAIIALVALIAVKGDEIQAHLQALDNYLQGVFAVDWTKTFGDMGEPINALSATIKDFWDGAKREFDGIINFIRGVFTGDWERAWQGIVDIFGGIWDQLSVVAKAPMNAVIALMNSVVNGINHMVDGLNSISIDVPEWAQEFAGESFGFNIPHIGKIPYLASGGILSHGSAVVGEAGAELLTVANGRAIVQPLTNNTNNYAGATNNFYIQSNDPYAVAEQVSDILNQRVNVGRATWA